MYEAEYISIYDVCLFILWVKVKRCFVARKFPVAGHESPNRITGPADKLRGFAF